MDGVSILSFNGITFDPVHSTFSGTPLLSGQKHLINLRAYDNYQYSKGMYKIQLVVVDTDPMAPTGLPMFTNSTLKCKILKQNLTIDRWDIGETKMLDFSYCLAKIYARQYYTL